MHAVQLKWSVIFCALLILQGCGGDKEEAAAPVLPRLAPPPVAKPAPPHGDLSVVILPEQPLVETPLVAAFRGEGTVGFSWQRNGETIPGTTGEHLAVGNFAKGDTVTVIARSGDKEYRTSAVIGNTPPRIKKVVFRDAAIRAGQPIELQIEAEDPDGDPITYAYRWMRNEEANVIGEGAILPAGSFARGDRIGFMVTPSDGELEGIPYQGSAVEVPNAPPVITSQPPMEFLSTVYRYDVKAMDPDGDPLGYALESSPEGMTIDAATGRLSWPITGVAAGGYQVSIVVTDAAGAKSYQDYQLTLQ